MATKEAPGITVQEPVVVVYDNRVETLISKIVTLRNTQELLSIYSQEQVGQVFPVAAIAVNHQRIPLTKPVVTETGMGIVKNEVIENHYTSKYIYDAYKNTRTCGVSEQGTSFGVQIITEPIDMIATAVPMASPTSAAIFKMLLRLETRNAILICPRPRARKNAIIAARVALNATMAVGALKGITTWIGAPSVKLTSQTMKEVDLILTTGGSGMVQTAYPSDKPAIGVGAGNTPAIIDDSVDLILTVSSIIRSRTFDNDMVCISEQSVTVLDDVYKQVKAELTAHGCYLLNPDETEEVHRTILIDDTLNSKTVGQSVHTIARLPDSDVPKSVKILTREVESVEPQKAFTHEKLSPVLAMCRTEDFANAIQKAERLIVDGEYGRTSSLYVNAVARPEKLRPLTAVMKTCRVPTSTPAAQDGTDDLYNFKLPPPLTLDCGSWGGNSVSENMNVKHLLNVKTVMEREENILWFRTLEKVYFK